jgi:hypothetical protein
LITEKFSEVTANTIADDGIKLSVDVLVNGEGENCSVKYSVLVVHNISLRFYYGV